MTASELSAERNVRALLWYALGAAPVALSALAVATNAPGAVTRNLATWWAGQQSVAGAGAGIGAAPAFWPALCVLAAGAWCWKRTARVAPTAAGVAPLAWALMGLTAIGFWLGACGISGTLPQVAARLAPVAVTLGVVALARSYERAAARRGGFGFVLLWLWVWLAVTVNATLFLVGGIIALEAIAAAQRRTAGKAARSRCHRPGARYRVSMLIRCRAERAD